MHERIRGLHPDARDSSTGPGVEIPLAKGGVQVGCPANRVGCRKSIGGTTGGSGYLERRVGSRR